MKNHLKNILELFGFLTASNRRLVVKTLALSVVVTALEMFTLVLLGAIIESLIKFDKQHATQPKHLEQLLINIPHLIDPAIAMPLVFAFVIVLTTLARLQLTRMQAKVSQDVGHTISLIIYDSYLRMDYDRVIRISTSDIIANIINKSMQVVRYTIHPLLQSITALIMLLGFFSSFIIMGYAPYTVIILISALLYYAVVRLARKRLTSSAKIISEMHAKIVSNISVTFGGIRNTVLENLGEVKRDQFSRRDQIFRGSEADSLYISVAPKHIIEGVIMLSLAAAIIYIQQSSLGYIGHNTSIAAFGLIIIIFQKSLPLMQSIFYASTNASVGSVVLEDILSHLKQEHKERKMQTSVLLRDSSELHLKDEIELRNISYKYPLSSEFSLKDVNIRIKSGDRIAIFGQTGSGKSTLLDILAALLVPSSGCLVCDGSIVDSGNNTKWRSRVGYLPQSPFFEDGTVRSNLILDTSSQESLDHLKLANSLIKAGLSNDETEAKMMLDAKVGERGNLLSGGQRQKLALARILLTERTLILLDEATAALDSSSEKEMVDLIGNLPSTYTIIMVTHRPQPLALCTRFFHVKNSYVTEVDECIAKNFFN